MPTTKEKNKENQRRFYYSMSDEKRKKFNQQRYRKYKAKYNSRSKQWALDNPEKAQAATHNSQIRMKYPEIYESTNITNKELAEWLIKNREAVCPYCGDRANHIDHIQPLASGGSHSWENIRLQSDIYLWRIHELCEIGWEPYAVSTDTSGGGEFSIKSDEVYHFRKEIEQKLASAQ